MDFDIEINGIMVNAHYTQRSIDDVFLPLLQKLTELQKSKNRRIFAILAAPPGAGKAHYANF